MNNNFNLNLTTTNQQQQQQFHLATILQQLLTNNTNTVRSGEKELSEQLKYKASVVNLTALITSSTNDGVRHLASVLLRRHVRMHWITLDSSQKTFIQQQLLYSCIAEPVRVIRLNICYAVAALAVILLAIGKNGWPELLIHIAQWTRDSTDAGKREVGFVLLYAMSNTISLYLSEELNSICELYHVTLVSETDQKVLMAALRGAASLIENVNEAEDILAFQNLIPILIQALTSLTSDGKNMEQNEEVIIQTIDGLNELSCSPVPCLNPFAATLAIRLCGIICSSQQRNNNGVVVCTEPIRSAALVCLMELLGSRVRLCLKDQVAFQAILDAILSIALETVETYHIDTPSPLELAPREMLESLVTTFTTYAPIKRIAEPLLNLCAQLMASNNTLHQRISGSLILTVSVEGLAEVLDAEGPFFSILLKLLLDMITTTTPPPPDMTTSTNHHQQHAKFLYDSMIRAALVSIGQLAEYCGTDITEQHATILPLLLNILSTNDSPQVRRAAIYLTYAFCENMESEELEPYVATITKALLYCFSSAPSILAARDALETLATLVQAISIPENPSQVFKPFLHECIVLSITFISANPGNLSVADAVSIRASATQLLGKLLLLAEYYTQHAQLVLQNQNQNQQQQQPIQNPYIQDIPEILNRVFIFPDKNLPENNDISDADYDEMIQSSYKFCADIVLCLKSPRVDSFIPAIMTKIFEECHVFDNNDIQKVVIDRDTSAAAALSQTILGIDHDDDDGDNVSMEQQEDTGGEDDDGDDKEEWKNVPGRKIRTGVRESAADLKVCLLFALDLIFEHVTPHICFDYIPHAINITEKASKYDHPTVRASAVATMASVVLCLYKCAVASHSNDGVTTTITPDSTMVYNYARSTHTEDKLMLEWLPGTFIETFANCQLHHPACQLFQLILEEKLHKLILYDMKEDRDKEVAAAACESLMLLLKHIGPNALPGSSAGYFVEALVLLFSGGAVSQSGDDAIQMNSNHTNNGDENNGGNDEDDEERRHCEILIDSVSDTLAYVAQVIGPNHFGPFLPKVLPVLLRYSKETMPSRDRVTGTGCLAQIIQAMTPWGNIQSSQQYFNSSQLMSQILKIAHTGIKNVKEPSVNRNGTFLLGCMAEAGLLDMDQTISGLQALRASFETFSGQGRKRITKWGDENRDAALDNACGAAARLISRAYSLYSSYSNGNNNNNGNTSNFFLEPAIVGLISMLPLRVDHQEDWVCYDTLATVYSVSSIHTQAAIRDVANKALSDPQVDGQVTRIVLHTILNGQNNKN
jgi:hypothetical protein